MAPDEYGRYELAISLVEFVGLILSLLTCFARGAKDRAGQLEEARELLGTGLILAVLSGAAVQLLAPLSIGWLQVDFNEVELRWGLAACALTGLIEMPLVWARFNVLPEVRDCAYDGLHQRWRLRARLRHRCATGGCRSTSHPQRRLDRASAEPVHELALGSATEVR